MILTEWRTVTMKEKTTKTCTSTGRQPLTQLLNTEMLMAGVGREEEEAEAPSRRSVLAVMEIF